MRHRGPPAAERGRRPRRLALVCLVLTAVVAGASRGIAETAGGAARASAPTVGDPAPDFALTALRLNDFRLDEREITRENAWRLYEPVRLSDFRGKRPVVLVFGSTTSGVRAALPALEDLHRTYGDRVAFLFVYIREGGARDGDAWREPETQLERLRIANSFADEVALSIPCVVDGMNDAAMQAYAAHPARLFLVGRDGRIVFAGDPGAVGMDSLKLGAALATPSSPPEAAASASHSLAPPSAHDFVD